MNFESPRTFSEVITKNLVYYFFLKTVYYMWHYVCSGVFHIPHLPMRLCNCAHRACTSSILTCWDPSCHTNVALGM